MLINVGLRTDIVRHYTEWLFRRFAAGEVLSRNPLFPHRVTRYTLDPASVDAVLFCSKNYAPALSRIREIADRHRTLFHATVNGYGRETEPDAPDLDQQIETLRSLSKLVGRERIYWRYDPILLTDRYTPAWHAETFSFLAPRIAPFVSGCIVNFVETFILLQSRFPALLPLSQEDKRAIARSIGDTAEKLRLPVRMCAANRNAAENIPAGGCVTLSDIGRANGCRFREIAHRGNRRNCACIVSRDIGWYDSCPSLCAYCNANRDPGHVADNFAQHDPVSPLLIGYPTAEDRIIDGATASYLAGGGSQLSLFDF